MPNSTIGLSAPSISGVTMLWLMKPPLIPIGSFSHSSASLFTFSGAKSGMFLSVSRSTI